MSRVCELTGKGVLTGNKVSHSNIKTRKRWLPNLQKKKYLIPELGQTMSLRLSTSAIKTIDKVGGITPAIRKAKEGDLSERLAKVKRSLDRQARKVAEKSAPKA
ncbi:MAG: 50S ribosomal protein L28 [Bdellovibrionaceae bacterium]|nr:50S ribosomal protein L28 [Pseudobdellovibrionaceae bacterium]